MKSKQIMFFGLIADMSPVLKKMEYSFGVRYFKTGMFDDPDIPQYSSIFDVPNLGFTQSGDWNRIDSYLMMPSGIQLKIRDVPQRAGSIKYAVDQSTNKSSIVLKLGGIYLGGENILVAGQIGTISDSEFSLDVYKSFSSSIKKEFKGIGAFYVGKHAEEKLRNGWRLVTNDKSPKQYDLAIG